MRPIAQFSELTMHCPCNNTYYKSVTLAHVIKEGCSSQHFFRSAYIHCWMRVWKTTCYFDTSQHTPHHMSVILYTVAIGDHTYVRTIPLPLVECHCQWLIFERSMYGWSSMYGSNCLRQTERYREHCMLRTREGRNVHHCACSECEIITVDPIASRGSLNCDICKCNSLKQ